MLGTDSLRTMAVASVLPVFVYWGIILLLFSIDLLLHRLININVRRHVTLFSYIVVRSVMIMILASCLSTATPSIPFRFDCTSIIINSSTADLMAGLHLRYDCTVDDLQLQWSIQGFVVQMRIVIFMFFEL